MSISKSSSLALRLAMAPPLALAAFGLLLGAGIPPVADWFWPAPTTNVAEAAALGDAARVRALVAAGARLDRPLPMREAIRRSNEPSAMTPLEAAKRRGNDELVELLLDLEEDSQADAATAGVP